MAIFFMHDFVMHPFEMGQSTEYHSWSSSKLMDVASIDQLVHNDAERERLLEENSYVTDRQLVHRKVSYQDLAEERLAAGENLETLTLPGLDGVEYQVVVDHWEASSKDAEIREGHLYGHLQDDPESEVLWAYYEGRESGKISSERLGIELNIDPREDRQVILKKINIEALAAYEEHVLGRPECGTRYNQLAVGHPEATFDRRDTGGE